MKNEKPMNASRRKFLRNSAIAAVAGFSLPLLPVNILKAAEVSGNNFFSDEPFSLPNLTYAYDALEPNIDRMTMEIHHSKHHKAYVDNLNKAVKEFSSIPSLEDLVKNVSKYTVAIRNHGGGHWNHSFFWKIMKPGGGGIPTGKIAKAINDSFGSFDEFKTRFEDISLKRFGSGWAWLVMDSNKKLAIGSTPNQDNPLMDISDFKGKPIVGIDVWEHAYYLKYQNKRADYLKAWWNVLNWEEINKNLEASE